MPWSSRAISLFMRGDRERLLQSIDDFDAFDDWPWPLLASDLMEALPTAKFVLTRRTSEHVWLNSILRHAKRTPGGAKIRSFVFGHPEPEGNQTHYIDFYLKFYQKIADDVRRIGCGDRVLSVCWEEGDGWEKLCSFLNEPIPNRPFPHFNSSRENLLDMPRRVS